jgi:putative N6-adenine-specific DNA methylase
VNSGIHTRIKKNNFLTYDMVSMFAVTAPGLKEFALHELQGLGLIPVKQGRSLPGEQGGGPGGAAFQGSYEDLYRANLHLRTVSRVLVRLGDFHATALSELRKKAGRLSWEQYLEPGAPLSLRVSCRKSRLYHSGAVAERVVGAITYRLGKPPAMEPHDEKERDPPVQLVLVRLFKDQVTISLDSSGENLHRRGYRKETAKAPLRETLAAAMLYAGGWDGKMPLLDPFCGSGTIPIEGALMARKLAPGRERRFAFMDWPSFDKKMLDRLLDETRMNEVDCLAPIIASDRDAGAVKTAEANAARAGVLGCIEFSQRAVSAVEAPGIGLLVSNPPYGLRVSQGKDLRNLYDQLGNVLIKRFQGWRVVLLGSQKQLITRTGVDFHKYISTNNGGVNVFIAIGNVPPRK